MKARFLTVLALGLAFATTAIGVGPDNTWTDGSGKWETSNNWSLALAPSLSDSADLITNAGNNTVTIDATTANTSSAMTISNLTIAANTLQLTNAGTNTPLHILNVATLSSGASLLITNSALSIDGVNVGSDYTLAIGGATNDNASMTVLADSSVTIGGTIGAVVGRSNGSSGTLTLAGGTFNCAAGLTIATGLHSSTGTVWITGGNLIANLYVDVCRPSGFQTGAGSLILSNGTLVTSQLHVAGIGGGDGTFTMEGGTANVALLVVGSAASVGTGSVNLNGGTLFVTNASQTAVLTVDQGGTLTLSNAATLVADSLITTNPNATFINLGGTFILTGQATIDQGVMTVSGTNQMSSNLVVAASASSTGAVSLTGGSLVVTNGTFGIGNDGTVGGTGGVAQVTVSGGLLQAASILVGDNFGSPSSFTVSSNGHVVVQGGLRVNGNHTTTVTDKRYIGSVGRAAAAV